MSNYKLYQGDCLEVMKNIEDGSVDLILTDPPYGTTACKWDSVIPFDTMWEQLNRIIKPNGAIVLFGSEPFSSALRMSNIKNYKYDWVWVKPQGTDPLMARFRPMNNIENISVFYRKTASYYEQCSIGKPYQITRDKNERINETTFLKTFKETTTINTGTRKPLRTLYYNKDKGLHPTQKPVALLEYLIKTYTLEGEIVLDFTMGSGSTGVACLNTNRNFIGIELDEGYFEIAQNRIEEAANKTTSIHKVETKNP